MYTLRLIYKSYFLSSYLSSLCSCHRQHKASKDKSDIYLTANLFTKIFQETVPLIQWAVLGPPSTEAEHSAIL